MIDFENIFGDELKIYTRKSYDKGSIDAEGNYIENHFSLTYIKATQLQPLKMGELQKLPDGEKIFSYVRFYTADQLTQGDVIIDDGSDYEVMQIENRQSYCNVYLRVM